MRPNDVDVDVDVHLGTGPNWSEHVRKLQKACENRANLLYFIEKIDHIRINRATSLKISRKTYLKINRNVRARFSRKT